MRIPKSSLRLIIHPLLLKTWICCPFFSLYTWHKKWNCKLFGNVKFPCSWNSLKSAEAVVRRCSVKKVLLEISQNSKENTCVRASFLTKLEAWGLRPATLLKKKLWHDCFPLNFAKFLRTPFFIEHL